MLSFDPTKLGMTSEPAKKMMGLGVDIGSFSKILAVISLMDRDLYLEKFGLI